MWITLLEIIFVPWIMWSHSVFMTWEPTILRFGHAHILPCTYKPPIQVLSFDIQEKEGLTAAAKTPAETTGCRLRGGGGEVFHSI